MRRMASSAQLRWLAAAKDISGLAVGLGFEGLVVDSESVGTSCRKLGVCGWQLWRLGRL